MIVLLSARSPLCAAEASIGETFNGIASFTARTETTKLAITNDVIEIPKSQFECDMRVSARIEGNNLEFA